MEQTAADQKGVEQKAKPASTAQQQQLLKPKSAGSGRPSPVSSKVSAVSPVSAATDVGSPVSADQPKPTVGVYDEEELR